ncbi:hypothetical protein ABZ920_18460 [Streptomyces sp. NPDC046831]|uniref:hypothetical protein n=1 Tax=Streptomyces sp. NPDC046831 TaxID=3154805 RepID=UPI00340309CF
MIDETHVAELLAAPDDDAALILLEGRAQVVDAASLAGEDCAGAAVLLTRAELAERLGTATPAEHEVRLLARTLGDTAGKLGA